MGGAAYLDGYVIALLLMAACIVPLWQNLGIAIVTAQNRHRYRAALYTGMALCNAVISIPLCRSYGGIGCALGTAVSMWLANGLLMNRYYHRHCGMDMRAYWRAMRTLPVALIAPVLYGIASFFLLPMDAIIPNLLSAAGFVLVYGLSMWRYGLTSHERAAVQGRLRQNRLQQAQIPQE